MQTIIGVRFKKAGKIYYFSPGKLDIAKGDNVIVETARGMEYGCTVIGPREVEDETVVSPLKVVQRKATEADKERVASNKVREQEAFGICETKIAEHGLPMKLVDVEYTFDGNKIVFYFTADGRIDFRELVKDLAAVFRTRIELRQIGVRDEAKLMGGIGCCGRPLCCASFLGDFEPVSIRMAKEQNLSLNPTKISGICSRLMCCLKYESDSYEEACPRKVAVQEPRQGARIVSVEGEGKVISVNSQRHTATILLDDNKTIVASWEDIIEKDEEEEGTELQKPPSSQDRDGQGALEDPFGQDGGNRRRASRSERPRKPRRDKERRGERKDAGEKRDASGSRSRDSRSRRAAHRENRDAFGSRSRERRPQGHNNHRGNGKESASRHGGYGTPFSDGDSDAE